MTDLVKRANNTVIKINTILSQVVKNIGDKICPEKQYSSKIGVEFCQFSNCFFVHIPNDEVIINFIRDTFMNYDIKIYDISDREKTNWVQLVITA